LKPFVGVDGEGAGEGLDHIYWLLRVGDKALYTEQGSNLHSIDILKWLADIGEKGFCKDFIPVGYYFDYDTTMILRSLPLKNLQELYDSTAVCLKKSCQHIRTTHWKNYGSCTVANCGCAKYAYGGSTTIFLDHDPPAVEKKNCLQVTLSHRQFKVGWFRKDKIVITDVADFFQSTFVNTLGKWDIGTPEEQEEIRVNKDRRAYFKWGYDQQTFDYNALECKLLAELMEEFRKVCFESNLVPDMWTGPGRLAESLFKLEGVPLRADLNIPPMIEKLSDYAYFGGRSEGIHFGPHFNVSSNDIASAYPWAYTMLPCLRTGHGEWKEVSFEDVEKYNLQNTLIVGLIHVNDANFVRHPKICGLPMRDKNGAIRFPTLVHGCWWYPEVRATLDLYKEEHVQYKTFFQECFTWVQTCNETPGAFTERWYQRRLDLGKSTRGIPIKLTLNSLYGKAAQRVGSAKWANPCWAGLLTALVRARCLEITLELGSENIISFQTDGVFSKKPSVQSFKGPKGATPLGAWEGEDYARIFLIQSGVYSLTEHPSSGNGESVENGEGRIVNKTRGMRSFEFEGAREDIEQAWEKKGWTGSFTLPKRKAFVTIKLGLMWNKTELIGCWLDQDRTLNFFSNADKRDLYDLNMDRRWEDGKYETFYTTDGTTYAPGRLHRKLYKLAYGPHPLFPEDKELADFSIPYSKELSNALYEKMKKQSENWEYLTPDEPYIMEDE
jgi:DNA polymerase type B, organellar and viral